MDAGAGNWGGMVVVVVVRNGARLVDSGGRARERRTSEADRGKRGVHAGPSVWTEGTRGGQRRRVVCGGTSAAPHT